MTFTADSLSAASSPSHKPLKPKQLTTSQTISDIEADGVAIQVHRDSTDTWHIDVAAAGEAARQPLGLTIMHEGKLEHFEQLHPTNDSSSPIPHSSSFILHSSLLTAPLPAGIHQVTIFDSLGHVLADRLFFAWRVEQTAPTLTITGLKDQYEPFEPVTLDVVRPSVLPTDSPTPSPTISLTVRDAVRSDNTFDSGNIMTEMLLASEIKGFVPQPEYFFEADDAEHRRALDLLMLTQGWRRYGWRDMAVQGAWDLTHPAEHTQIVSGTVNNFFAEMTGFDTNLDIVMDEHEEFMRRFDTPLSEQNAVEEDITQWEGSDSFSSLLMPETSTAASNYAANNMSSTLNSISNKSYGWNLLPSTLDQQSRDNYFSSNSRAATSFSQSQEWRNDDYNVLSYRTNETYRQRSRKLATNAARRYLEEGSIRHDVRVHAEFVNAYNPKDTYVGEVDTHQGRFQIDLPFFDGQCLFYLDASDITKWKKNQKHLWVQVDPTDEYSPSPAFPEFYVRLNWCYPRWVKPYSYYQVHSAPMSVRGSSAASTRYAKSRLLTETTQLDEITIRARHGGLRRIDYSKPAYVIDAIQALNIVMDAGLVDYTFSPYEVGSNLARALVGDMGMERRYDLRFSEDQEPGKFRGPLEQKRYNRLTFIDNFYVYTDYSPRREGDDRYEQDNQPEVRIDIRRMPNERQRVTYINRFCLLNGFAFQEDFYSPDYERTPPTEATHDYRRTLYWNPALKLDGDGHAHVRLFNGSRPATLTVDAQGQSADGTLLFNNQ